MDANTHWFDVEQAHLSFLRQPQSSDSSMPSLGRLVRPTDWETVRSKLKKLPESLEMRLRLVDDSKKSMVAQVQVSRYRPRRSEEDGLKLCLQFTDIVLDGSKSPSRQKRNLAAINEQSCGTSFSHCKSFKCRSGENAGGKKVLPVVFLMFL